METVSQVLGSDVVRIGARKYQGNIGRRFLQTKYRHLPFLSIILNLVLLLLGAEMMTTLRSTVALEVKRIPVIPVAGVVGGTTVLPCHVDHPVDDDILLLLWFREGVTTPIYRYDDRSGSSHQTSKWSSEDAFGKRASLDILTVPSQLVVKTLQEDDQGLYYCRVDFRKQPTKTTRVALKVVVPPQRVKLFEGIEDLKEVSGAVGPFPEGAMVTLTCVAEGGRPLPSVVWLKDTHLLDSHMESEDPIFESTTTTEPPRSSTLSYSVAKNILQPSMTSTVTDVATENYKPEISFLKQEFHGKPFNTITVGPLERKDLKMLLTCEASNNNLTLPKSVVIMIDMNLPAVAIHLKTPDGPVEAGREYQVVCQVAGARPPPVITWWSGKRRVMQRAIEVPSTDGNITTSTLMFVPTPDDHNTTLQCVAESPATNTKLHRSWHLTVYYLPEATARFGASLNALNIKEADDVYFECIIDANPLASRVTWRHNNHLLHHNISGGVIVSNQSLVLQRVGRHHAGTYTCHAHNVIGEGGSNSLRLDIKYAPVCARDQVVKFAVSRNEDASVTCTVDANPPNSTFQWTFNNTADTIGVPSDKYSINPTHSVITYTPMTTLDYGTLLCWATNAIGTQRVPCLYLIMPAGKPDAPSNCTVERRMATSLRIVCSPGDSMGSEQVFHLQAKASTPEQPTINMSSKDPEFLVENLAPGVQYAVEISAENDRGRSPFTSLTIASGQPSSSSVGFPVGPSEAEVRESGKSKSSSSNINSPAPKSSSDDHPDGFSNMSDNALLPAALGAGVGLLLVLLIIVILVTLRVKSHRNNSSHLHEDDNTGRLVGSTPHLASVGSISLQDVTDERLEHKLKVQHGASCMEREMQIDSETDADPDLIPLNPGICNIEWEAPTGPIQFLGNVSSGNVPQQPLGPPPGMGSEVSPQDMGSPAGADGRASTLLPPDRYAYSCAQPRAGTINPGGWAPRMPVSTSAHAGSSHISSPQQKHHIHLHHHHHHPPGQQQQSVPIPSSSITTPTSSQLQTTMPIHGLPSLSSGGGNLKRPFVGGQPIHQRSFDLVRVSPSSSTIPSSHLLPSSTSSSPTSGPHDRHHMAGGVGTSVPESSSSTPSSNSSSTLPRHSSSGHRHHQHLTRFQQQQQHQVSSSPPSTTIPPSYSMHQVLPPRGFHQQHQDSASMQQGGCPTIGQREDVHLMEESPLDDMLDNIPEPPPSFREESPAAAKCTADAARSGAKGGGGAGKSNSSSNSKHLRNNNHDNKESSV